MENIHECRVQSLKNQKWFKKLNKNKFKFVMSAQQISNIQAFYKGKYYRIENHNRIGIASKKNRSRIIDIIMGDFNDNSIKSIYLDVLREKILNDINTYEELIRVIGIEDKMGRKDLYKVVDGCFPNIKRKYN